VVSCGVLAHHRWPLWMGALEVGLLDLRWIMGVPEEIQEELQRAFPHALLTTNNIVDEMFSTYPVTVLLCEKRVPPVRSKIWGSSALKFVVSESERRSPVSPPGWHSQDKELRHCDLGGVTDGTWSVTLNSRVAVGDDAFVFDAVPQGSLSSCIDQGAMGRPCVAPQDSQSKQTEVRMLRPGLYSSKNALFACAAKADDKFVVPAYRSKTGWCTRNLTQDERRLIWDITPSVRRRLGVFKDGPHKRLVMGIPMKIRAAVLRKVRELANIEAPAAKSERKRCCGVLAVLSADTRGERD
jgi:hypothetical protein